MSKTEPTPVNRKIECPTCRSLITESNKSLICTECGTQFCDTCEGWFRGEQKRGEAPLCKTCYVAELGRLREVAECKAQMVQERLEREAQEKSVKQGMKFTLIPAGELMMGSNEYPVENHIHKVKINKPFYLGTYLITQREWKAVMGDNPSDFKGDDLPVENVSWYDVQEFIKVLNEKEEGADRYRLPSEAEWEYACRAGTTTAYSFGDGESRLNNYAWYGDSDDKTHPVGKKEPNPYGLYDIHGNVGEWVQDSWHDNYDGAPIDGSAWQSGNADRVVRGGSWLVGAWYCRSAFRAIGGPHDRNYGVGFRLLEEI